MSQWLCAVCVVPWRGVMHAGRTTEWPCLPVHCWWVYCVWLVMWLHSMSWSGPQSHVTSLHVMWSAPQSHVTSLYLVCWVIHDLFLFVSLHRLLSLSQDLEWVWFCCWMFLEHFLLQMYCHWSWHQCHASKLYGVHVHNSTALSPWAIVVVEHQDVRCLTIWNGHLHWWCFILDVCLYIFVNLKLEPHSQDMIWEWD